MSFPRAYAFHSGDACQSGPIACWNHFGFTICIARAGAAIPANRLAGEGFSYQAVSHYCFLKSDAMRAAHACVGGWAVSLVLTVYCFWAAQVAIELVANAPAQASICTPMLRFVRVSMCLHSPHRHSCCDHTSSFTTSFQAVIVVCLHSANHRAAASKPCPCSTLPPSFVGRYSGHPIVSG